MESKWDRHFCVTSSQLRLLFSATLHGSVHRLGRAALRSPEAMGADNLDVLGKG